MRKDGQLQASFGLGKYANRNVLDGFAGVQRGTQQRTVRASRVLSPRIDDMAVGPLRYEVIEPFKAIRLTLAENTAQPLRFELTFHATMPAFFEKRDVVIARRADGLRYDPLSSGRDCLGLDRDRGRAHRRRSRRMVRLPRPQLGRARACRP